MAQRDTNTNVSRNFILMIGTIKTPIQCAAHFHLLKLPCNENKGTPSTIPRGVTMAPSSQSKAQAIPPVRMKNSTMVSSYSRATGDRYMYIPYLYLDFSRQKLSIPVYGGVMRKLTNIECCVSILKQYYQRLLTPSGIVTTIFSTRSNASFRCT
jgi:hypothetical protein